MAASAFSDLNFVCLPWEPEEAWLDGAYTCSSAKRFLLWGCYIMYLLFPANGKSNFLVLVVGRALQRVTL